MSTAMAPSAATRFGAARAFHMDTTPAQALILQTQRTARCLPAARVGKAYLAPLTDQPGVRLLPGTHLPLGLELSRDGRSLVGTPVQSGSFWVEFAERDERQRCRWVLQVTRPDPVWAIAAPSVPSLAVGSRFSLDLALTGAAERPIWYVASGQLPPGVRLHAHSGALYGIPTTPGDWSCSIGVAADDTRCELPLTLRVLAAPRHRVTTPSLVRVRSAASALPSRLPC